MTVVTVATAIPFNQIVQAERAESAAMPKEFSMPPMEFITSTAEAWTECTLPTVTAGSPEAIIQPTVTAATTPTEMEMETMVGATPIWH